MKLAIMQPYFMPYIGYFSLIKNVDKFVFFDTVQYINKGWLNRNRILSKSKEGVGYITVPVKKTSRDMLIKDALIDTDKNWKEKILGQLQFYKKKAPYYFRTFKLVEDILNYDTNKISELNIYTIKRICAYLDINTEFEIFSKGKIQIEKVNAPDEWALEISKALKAKQYINQPGGQSFFDKKKYDNAGIDLKFINVNLKAYKTFSDVFIPGLSIVDVLMFNTSEEINIFLDDFELF